MHRVFTVEKYAQLISNEGKFFHIKDHFPHRFQLKINDPAINIMNLIAMYTVRINERTKQND